MSNFAEATKAQYDKNIAKWGLQSFATLIIALGEEYGEVCQAFLQKQDAVDLKEEIIHAAALLQAFYEGLA